MVSRKDVGVFLSFFASFTGTHNGINAQRLHHEVLSQTCSQRRAIFVAIVYKDIDSFPRPGQTRFHRTWSLCWSQADRIEPFQTKRYKKATETAIGRWRILGTSKCPPPWLLTVPLGRFWHTVSGVKDYTWGSGRTGLSLIVPIAPFFGHGR